MLQERMRGGATVLWAIYPHLDLAEVVQHPAMMELIGTDIIPVPILIKWIRDLRPQQ
jgi:hypothetical protein